MTREEFFQENRAAEIYFATAKAVENLGYSSIYLENGTYLIALPVGLFQTFPIGQLEPRSWDDWEEVYRWVGKTRGRIGRYPCDFHHPDWGGWVL